MKPLDLEGRQSPSLVSGPLRLTRGLPLILTKFVPPRSSIQLLERPRQRGFAKSSAGADDAQPALLNGTEKLKQPGALQQLY